jgi:peptide/nickel transport system substrate-binding protein
VRQAVAYALNQKDFLNSTIGDAEYYVTCKSLYPCGSPLETTRGWEDKIESNFAKARALLAEAGYDGTPIVLMQSTDIASLANLVLVAKSLLEEAAQGRPACHGLADPVSRRAKGTHWRRRLERISDLVGLGRRARPGLDQLPQCQLRKRHSVGRDAELERLRDALPRGGPRQAKAIPEAVSVRATEYLRPSASTAASAFKNYRGRAVASTSRSGTRGKK